MFISFLLVFINLFSTLALIVPSRIVTVVFLIITYCLTVVLLLILQMEFLAVSLLIVYVGAISIFFLFIVMVLGGKSPQRPLSKEFLINFLMFLIVGYGLLSCSPFPYFSSSVLGGGAEVVVAIGEEISTDSIEWVGSNVFNIGSVLYTFFFPLFFGAMLILFLAIVGVVFIVSLSRSRDKSKENTLDQTLRIQKREEGAVIRRL